MRDPDGDQRVVDLVRRDQPEQRPDLGVGRARHVLVGARTDRAVEVVDVGVDEEVDRVGLGHAEELGRLADLVLAELERLCAERRVALVPVDPDELVAGRLPLEPVVVVDDALLGAERDLGRLVRPRRPATAPRSACSGSCGRCPTCRGCRSASPSDRTARSAPRRPSGRPRPAKVSRISTRPIGLSMVIGWLKTMPFSNVESAVGVPNVQDEAAATVGTSPSSRPRARRAASGRHARERCAGAARISPPTPVPPCARCRGRSAPHPAARSATAPSPVRRPGARPGPRRGRSARPGRRRPTPRPGRSPRSPRVIAASNSGELQWP